jgi:hypothetical protein
VELNQVVIPGRTVLQGSGAVTIEAGQYIQIRHGPSGSPVVDLEEQCPTGKVWKGTVKVDLVQQDA